MDFHGVAGPRSIRFEPSHAAVGLDAGGKVTKNLRWALPSKGDIHIRQEDGRLLLKCNIDALGHLVFALSKDSRSYDVALEPRG